ncbi:cysteine hydrolase [Micromonospora sp. KC213]|uniref:cysteine hydrolase family protein n=1 Tax=Micromonospora sp. KC213 TaxID=2530378 RepID=UPI0010499B46|nr:cysteine hydrolase [Micromonospora sp. KC213]TDC32135.1 cysteine hydrolase [Micromonospora sp. KC213]
MMPDIEMDPTRVAVIGVHWQHDVVSPDGLFGPYFADQVARHRVASYAARLMAAVRSSGGLVVHSRIAFRPGYPDLIANTPAFATIGEQRGFLDGDPKTEIIDEVAPQVGDIVFTHARLTAFFGTELDVILRARGVKTVLLTGVATNLSVAGTAFEAVNHGYRMVVVSDACAAATDEMHRVTLEGIGLLGQVVTTDDVVRGLTG